MKNKTLLPALCLLGALCAGSCTDNSITSGMTEKTDSRQFEASLRVLVNSGSLTRGTVAAADAEKVVNNIQVFVFRETGGADNGTLDSYASSTGSEVEINCSTGNKMVYAVANAPSLGSIGSAAQLKSTVTSLQDNYNSNALNLVMVGKTSASVATGGNDIEISVYRKAARVRLSRVDMDLPAAFDDASVVVKSVYLTNVASVAHLDETYAPSATQYLNKGAYSSSAADKLVYKNLNYAMDRQGSMSGETLLYAYPNPSEGNDTALSPWTVRRTRLVIECLIDSQTYYYPINLPSLQANKSYEIERVTIHRTGSTTPDTPIVLGGCTFSINVVDWDGVSVSEGVEI